MQIIKGKHKGKTATLHQFANDWMSVDITDGDRGVIVNPTMVRADSDERQRLAASCDAYREGDHSTGRFWAEWQMHPDGTFTRLHRTLRPRRT